MRTIWQSLAWKEWHEHKWKLVSITAVLWSIAALFLLDPDRGTIGVLHVGLAMAIIPMAVFVGLGTAASERSRGTLAFLHSLPVPMWRVAIAKLTLGLATVVLPALLSVVLCFVRIRCYERVSFTAEFAAAKEVSFPFILTSDWYANAALFLVLIAVSFYIWTSAAGVNRRDEVSAGAVAMTAIVAWCLLVFAVWSALGNSFGTFKQWPSILAQWCAVLTLATTPGGLATVKDATDGETAFFLPAVFVATIAHSFLAFWYIRRFGRIANVEIRSPKTATSAAGQLDWLGPPRRSAFTAIAWKQFRESGPIVLAGIVGTIAMTTVFVFFDRQIGGRWRISELVGEVYANISVLFGVFVALVVGIGVFLSDLGPRLNTFWRSRPIQPDMWFWNKFSCGLVVVLTSIYAPIGFLAALGTPVFVGWNYPDSLTIPILQITFFAAGVVMTCLVRNAIYAAIMSIAVVYLGFVVTAITLAVVQVLRGEKGPEFLGDIFFNMSAVQTASGLLSTFIICTIIAWLAVRNDWGQKSRS